MIQQLYDNKKHREHRLIFKNALTSLEQLTKKTCYEFLLSLPEYDM